MTFPENRRILLIDDMPSIHDDFRKILALPAGRGRLQDIESALFDESATCDPPAFELDSAYQGQEGVAMVEAAVRAGRPYAMAFVDMLMPPGLDGVETTERLWRVDPHVQVVICTAYSDHPWQDVLRRLDVQDRLLIIKKPFDMIEVSQLARTLTAKWALARQADLHISSLESAVQELKATEARLRRSNEDLESFAHSVSHDLRSPLIAMGAFSNLLAKELEEHPSVNVQHYLERIRAGAATGEQLIEGLLDLARIARAHLHVEEVDLSALTRELLQELRRADPQRQTAFTVQEGLWVLGDRRLIQLAMRQLLGNAWKFSSRRPHSAIEVGGYEGAGNESVYFVRDNGEGFDMAYAGKLFRTFQRLHTSKDFPGIGMGLVTATRVIDRHGGRVWADSKPGEGATFYFTLPSASRRGPVGNDPADLQPKEATP